MEARSPAYIAVLAVVAGSILMVGSLMKPADDDSDTENLPQAELIPPLMLLTQRGSLEDMAEYFARSASDASRHLVLLKNPRQTGIVWDETGAVITSNQEQYFPAQVEAVSSTSARLTLKATRPPPEAPVVALRPVSGIAGNPALHLRALFLTHGEWLIVTWLTDPMARSFRPGLYLGSRAVECGGRPVREISLSVTPTREMAGGGVFDFDGNLIGLVALCDGRYAALVPESVDEIVAWSSRFEGRLLAQYGLRVSVLDGNEQEYFAGDETVLVREVWRGLPADAAGLRPGDLIVTFDGRPAKTPDDLQPLVLPAARELLELRVRRGRRTVTAVLPAQVGARLTAASGASGGLVLAPEPEGFLIDSVILHSAAAKAGIQSGDRLVTVDGSIVSDAAQARRILDGQEGTGRFVVIERGSRRWGTLLSR